MFNNNENNERSRTLSTSSVSISEGYTSPSEFTDELEHLNDDNEDNKEVVIVQFAQKVLDFSSQYGSDYSISYTACNIAGRPSKFPNYGDFPETFAMVTYARFNRYENKNNREVIFTYILCYIFTANVRSMVGSSTIENNRYYGPNSSYKQSK